MKNYFKYKLIAAGETDPPAVSFRDVETLLIHCYAGQSRSRAGGAFALKILGGDNLAYFKKYNPNTHVYNTLAENWNKLLSDEDM